MGNNTKRLFQKMNWIGMIMSKENENVSKTT